MMESIITAVVLDTGRSNSLKHFPTKKISKMKLFKTNSVPHVKEDILNGVGGAGGMEGVGGRAASKVGGTAASSTTSRGSSSSGSSGQGVGGGGGVAMTSAGLTSSTQTLAVTSTPRSPSLASISSDGSADSHLVEREDIVALTTAVRAFKEALGKLKRIFHPERDKNETLRVAAHERLGEVLRILRSILERYSPIQHNELLAAASHLISHVNGFSYEDEQGDPTAFLEAIDQLALAFSSRVSEYLMGDIDSSSAILNCSNASSRNKSCENLVSSDAESTTGERGLAGVGAGGCVDTALKEPEVLTPQQIDEHLHRHEQGVEYALHRAKVWSKYSKDVMTYIEKRAQMDLEHARNLTKLAHTVRPALKEESFLPFQSIYCTALDQDIENSSQLSQTCTLLQTHKFIEPLTTRRNEHERSRKAIKDAWHKELKRVTEAVSNLKKSKVIYVQRQQEVIKAREMVSRADNTEALEKLERKRDEALQKAREAEVWYKACVSEANERHASLLRVKRDVLVQARELILQCDQTMKAVTVAYFQLQHTVAAPAPVQLQTLCESSRLYEPGSQYMEFVKRLGPSMVQEQPEAPFTFQPYTPGAQDLPPNHDSTANGSMASTDDLQVGRLPGQGGSDTDSVDSSHSAKSADASPTHSPRTPTRRTHTISSGDELETDPDNVEPTYRRQVMSKAAVSHTFRKLKTPSRCRECDSYVYFHGYECAECGLGCHKKCLETLAIQCGHKRLPRKMTTFGVDLAQHLSETNTSIPHLVVKCVAEIDTRGSKIKGIYRVSGVKHRVEKLCQAFENGANLVDLTDQHPNVIANVLKLYLRQLPEPLLSFRLYPEFIRIAKECPTGGGGECARTTEELKELVRRLPRHHLNCLALLMHHLHRVTLHAPVNNMPSSNLGIVFGPTLLRTSEGSASLSSLVDTVHQTRAIELLIMFAYEIFGQPEQYQVPSVTPATRTHRLDEVLKHSTPSRQTSTHTSSSSSSSSSSGVVNVTISGYKRPPPELVGLAEDAASSSITAQHHALKERKDSDVLDEDWERGHWEDRGLEGGGVSPRPPTALPRSSSTQAKIYKTSLRDYVGLEGELPRRAATVDEPPRRGPPLEDTPRRSSAEDRKPIATSNDIPAKRPAALEDPQRRHPAEDSRRKSTLEEVGRKLTVEEPARGEIDQLNQTEERQRQPQSTSGAMLARAQALYKSASKSSMSESELKVDVRLPGVTKSGSRDGSSVEHGGSGSSGGGSSGGGSSSGGSGGPSPGGRKVSPYLDRPSLGQQRSGLTSGTDSSVDSDHSFDYGLQTHSLMPSSAHTSTPIPSPRGRSEVLVSGAPRGVCVSRDPSLDNVTSSVTSSDSSSQELDSAHATEDSHSSEAADEPDTAHARTITYSSGCGGSSGGESGYVSPYLSAERSGLVTLGPSLLLTRSTIAQYDTKRTITTVVAPRSSFDENRVRIQVPAAAAVAAAAAAGGGARGLPTATAAAAAAAVNTGAETTVTVSRPEQQQQSVEGPSSQGKESPLYTLRASEAEATAARRLHAETRLPAPARSLSQSPSTDGLQEHPRKPSPNRSPRFV
ncbi:rho GTPase-activating protein 45 isoform X4 [Cherax quadricarinatus]|uniref:rho GTPase-activating protein 45 isoform X4 n=1 Tax=Cherax quadricarinatus TaxID=27406 RepID=UPI00387E2684